MKYNKSLKNSIEKIPSEWKPFLIEYKTLKRYIKKIVQELNAKGVLQIMLNESNRIEYSLECYKSECGPVYIRPCVKVSLPFMKHDLGSVTSLLLVPSNDDNVELPVTPLVDHEASNMEKALTQTPSTSCIKLESDGKFFIILLEEIYQLNCLQKQNQDKFLTNLQNLQKLLIDVTSPFKKDLYTWRKIFQIYIEDKIFVGNTEADRKERNWKFSQEQLACFIDKVNKDHLIKKLKDPLSKIAFEKFLKLNNSLISMKQFQYLNQVTMSKILKKHDKKTHLNSISDFKHLMEKDSFLSESTFKSLCYELEQLTTIIPQLDDYNCPICLNIAWKPIRLCCTHVFCVRCLVKSIRKRTRNCPVCRAKNAIYNADETNLDVCHMNFLSLYFPREVYKKQKEDDRERIAEEMEAITGLRIDERQTCVLL